jgi:hypothetical protein
MSPKPLFVKRKVVAEILSSSVAVKESDPATRFVSTMFMSVAAVFGARVTVPEDAFIDPPNVMVFAVSETLPEVVEIEFAACVVKDVAPVVKEKFVPAVTVENSVTEDEPGLEIVI